MPRPESASRQSCQPQRRLRAQRGLDAQIPRPLTQTTVRGFFAMRGAHCAPPIGREGLMVMFARGRAHASWDPAGAPSVASTVTTWTSAAGSPVLPATFVIISPRLVFACRFPTISSAPPDGAGVRTWHVCRVCGRMVMARWGRSSASPRSRHASAAAVGGLASGEARGLRAVLADQA